jgi:hypothetical protein
MQTIANVNQAAYDKITLNYPIWKQINISTRALELVILGDSISAEEQEELNYLQLVFKDINSVRELSNTLVETITNCSCPVQLRQLEIDSINQIKNINSLILL